MKEGYTLRMPALLYEAFSNSFLKFGNVFKNSISSSKSESIDKTISLDMALHSSLVSF